MMSKHEFKHILSTHCNRHLSHTRPIAFRMHADSASITCADDEGEDGALELLDADDLPPPLRCFSSAFSILAFFAAHCATVMEN